MHGQSRSLPAVDLVEEVVPLGDRELTVLRPRNTEALIDEEQRDMAARKGQVEQVIGLATALAD